MVGKDVFLHFCRGEWESSRRICRKGSGGTGESWQMDMLDSEVGD